MDVTKEQLVAELLPTYGAEGRLQDFLDMLIKNFRTLLRQYGCDYSDLLLEAAHEAYLMMCQAVDIPAVPEALELKLESVIWSQWLQPTLQRIVQTICAPETIPISV